MAFLDSYYQKKKRESSNDNKSSGTFMSGYYNNLTDDSPIEARLTKALSNFESANEMYNNYIKSVSSDRYWNAELNNTYAATLNTYRNDIQKLSNELIQKGYNQDSDIFKALNTYDNRFENWNKALSEENKFFSQFDSEESYNTALSDYNEAVKISSMTPEDIDSSIAEIDDQINELKYQRDESKKNGNVKEVNDYDDQIAELSEKKRKLLQGKQQSKIDAFEGVTGDAGFKEFSDKGAAIVNPDIDKTYGITDLNIFGQKVENPVTFVRGNGAKALMSNNAGLGKYNNVDWKKRIQAMNETEVDIYNYYLAKEGREAADNYLDSIEERLTQRVAGNEFDSNYKGNTAYEIAFGIAAGLDQFVSGVKGVFDTRDYIPASISQTMSGMIREDLADDGFALPDWMGGASIGQAAYDFVTTGSNMIPSIATSAIISAFNPAVGATVGAGLMGVSAGGNAYQEMINLGYSKGQARFYAGLTGASEAVLQELIGGIPGVGSVLTDKGLETIAKGINNGFFKAAIKIGGNMYAEGMEEALQEILTPYFKAIATGEKPENINWQEVVYSGILGALTAAPSNVVTSVSNAVSQNRAYNDIFRGSEAELIESGLETDAQSEAYNLAQKYQSQMNDGKKLSGLQLGNLAKANENFNIAEDISNNKEEAKNRLTELGETGNVDTIASAVAKAIAIEQTAVASSVFNGDVNETKLTNAEKNAIKNSKYGNQVLSEIAQSMSMDGFTGEVGDFSRSNIRNNPYVAPKVTSNVVDFYNNQKKIANIGNDTTDVRKNRATDIPVRKSTAVDTSKVSDSGNTEVVVDGNTQEASINKITAVNKNGSFDVELDNGATVNSSEVLYSSASEALVYETIPKMVGNPGVANTVINAYKNSNIPADTFVDESMYAYQYGKTNQSKRLADLTNIPDEVKNTLFVVGRDNAKAEAQSRAKPDTKITKKSNKAILVNEVDEKQLTPKQKTVKSVADAIAKISNLDVYLFESYRKNGKIYNNINGVEVESGANGWYVEGSNAIYLDLNAGNNSEGLGLFTLSHEIGHAIREWSTAKWQTLADTVVEAIDNQAEMDSNTPTFEEMVADKLAMYKRLREAGNENYNYTDEQLEDMAYEDVVSDSFEKLMADEQTFSEIMDNIKKQDKSLWQKIKDFFKDFVNKLGNVLKSYENVDPETEAGKAIAQAQDMYDKIRSLYADAFTDVNRNIGEAMTPEEAERNQFSTDTLTGSQDGFIVKDATALPVSSITGVKQSTSTEREALPKMMMSVTGGENKIITSGMLEGINSMRVAGAISDKTVPGYTVAQIRQYAMSKNGFTKTQIKNVQKFMSDMTKFMKNAGITYRFINLDNVENAKLHYQYNRDGSIKSITLSAMVKNGDYPVNFDFTSICKKRAAMSNLIQKLSSRGDIDNGTVDLSVEKLAEINRILKDEGFETACLGCFVEAKRYNIQKWATSFIEKYNKAVLKYNPNATYFNFAKNDISFDDLSLDRISSIDDSLEKFAIANGKNAKENAKAKFREKLEKGQKIFVDKEGNDKPLSKTQKKKIVESYELSEGEKDYYLDTNPNDFTIEELERLVDCGIFTRATTNNQRVNSFVASSPEYQHLLKVSDLITAEGITQLEQLPNFHGLLYGHYGSGTPKLVQGFTPYNSEIALLPDKKGKQELSQYLYSIAGVRMQSFSDFQIQNVFDYLQMIADLSARKLPAHAYTKEISFGKLFGLTGLKINLSVMFDIDPEVDMEHAGLTKYNPEIHKGEYAKIVLSDEQGDWVYNVGDYSTQKAHDTYNRSKGHDVPKRFLQSIGFADAVTLEMSDGYTSDCGIIGVAFSDNHIIAMLDDNRIRYIIPYHSSSLPAFIKDITNINDIDYTATQNTMKIKKILDANKNEVEWSLAEAYKRLGSGRAAISELLAHIRNDGWTVETKKAQNGHGRFKLYENLQETNDPRQTVDNFFDWGAKNGTLPLFYQFAEHDNYYKLLYDYNVYDNITGEYAPQKEVQNIYPDNYGNAINITEDEYVSDANAMTGFQSIIDEYMSWQNAYNQQLDNRLDKIADDLTSESMSTEKLQGNVKVKKAKTKSSAYDNISSSPKKFSTRTTDDELYLTRGQKEIHPKISGWANSISEDGSILTEDYYRNVLNKPLYADVEEDATEEALAYRQDKGGKQGTQIESTISTYETVFDYIREKYGDDWTSKRVLDASSGLGLGTRRMRMLAEEYGGNPDNFVDLEPFPSENAYAFDPATKNKKRYTFGDPFVVETYTKSNGKKDKRNIPADQNWAESHKPVYTDYTQLQNDIRDGKIEQFDFIISNAVINVVPQDTRNQIIAAMGTMLKKGGTLYLNTMNKDYYINPANIVFEGDYSSPGSVNGIGHEGFIPQSNSVQKAFSKNELKSYVEDILEQTTGAEYEVVSAPGKITAMNTILVTKLTDDKVMEARKYSERKYTFDEFVAKHDMNVTHIDISKTYDRTDIIEMAKKNASKIGKTHNDGSVSVYVDDINSYVLLSKKGLAHGLDRRAGLLSAITINIGKILSNSIRINELTPKKKEANKSFILLGAAEDQDGSLHIVKSVINEFTTELSSINVLYSINTNKKSTAVHEAPSVSTPNYRTTISIAELLQHVNKNYPDILSEDILKHFGYTERPKGEFNEDLLYSDRSALTDNRSLLANAFSSIVQNPAEAQILEDYQANIDKMNAEEDKLRTLTAEMKQLSFGKGKRDKAKITKLQGEITKTKNRINIYDKKLLKLEASKPLQDILTREKDKVIKREKAKYKQALAEEKQKRTDAIQNLKEKNRQKIDQRKTTEVRNKIKKIASDLENRLLNGTERRYIPRQLVESVINVCDSIDPTGKDQNTKSAQKWKSGRAALAELKMAYDKLENFNDYDFSYEFDRDFSNLIGDFADAVGDTPLRDMSREQLEDVYTIVHDIRNMINDATKQIGTDEAISNYEAGQEVIENMRNVKSRKQTTNAVSDFFRNWTENPMRAVREMTGYDPNARLTKLFDELNKGRRKADDFRMKMQKKFDILRTSKEDAKKFNSAVQDKIDLGLLDIDGNPMKITKMQAMTILLTYDREMANKDRKHLVTPVLIPDAELERKGKYAQAKDRGRQLLVTDDLITKIKSQLNEWDKQYIQTAKEFFNDDSQKAINEVSMVTKHRPIATEKEYIPYLVDKDYVKKESENVKFDATIEGTGILKSMQKNATQQLLIKSLNELVADHIDKVAKIYGLAIPVRNFNKVFNMQQTVADGGVSVQRAIRDVWKDGGVKLVDQAVADLQSPRRGDTAKILSVAKSGFVTSTLSSNISVWMKQAASYPTAGAVLSSSSLTKGLARYVARKSSDVWQEIDEHTSQHYMRRQGLSMQELGELNQTKGWQNVINNKLGKVSPMNWIQAMDVATTAALWEASKAEAEKQGTMPADDSYWKVVTDIYNRVIEDTQPMYDPLHRAEITKNKALSNVILFQTQPIQNSGILREGAMRYKDMKKAYGSKDAKTKQAFKSYRMAVTSQMASHLTFTMMTLAAAAILHKMNPYRDDNKELTIESLLEEFGKQYGKNFFNAIVPVFGNYAVSIAEKIFGSSTYDVLSDATVDKINSTIDIFAKVKQKPTVENIINVFTEVASYLGVPANNIKNIVNAIRLHLKDIANGEFGSFEAGVERTNAQDLDRAYTYYSEGDLQKSKEIIQSKIDDKMSSGKTEKEAKSDIRASLTGYLKPIYLEAYKNKDNAKMAEIRKYMLMTGCYGKTDDITKACQDWIKQSKKK